MTIKTIIESARESNAIALSEAFGEVMIEKIETIIEARKAAIIEEFSYKAETEETPEA